MKVVAGLGNPGREYERTRHNIGFAVVDELARRGGADFRRSFRVPARLCELTVDGVALLLVKPWTFMNDSGRAVAPLLRKRGLACGDLIVVMDDIDLPCGRLRLRAGGGSGGHNGLKSLMRDLGADDFARVRVGIGREAGETDVVQHVLSRFRPEEQPIITESIQRAADAVLALVREGPAAAMNRFNG